MACCILPEWYRSFLRSVQPCVISVFYSICYGTDHIAVPSGSAFWRRRPNIYVLEIQGVRRGLLQSGHTKQATPPDLVPMPVAPVQPTFWTRTVNCSLSLFHHIMNACATVQKTLE